MRKDNATMLSGSITKGLLAVSLPFMVMSVIQSLFNIVDLTVLKTYSTDGLAVGAVGVCGTLITLITNLVVGIATGANVTVAKYIGQRSTENANRAAGTAVTFSAIAGLGLAVIGISGAPLFLSWVNCPEELFSRAVLYFRMYFLGVPILVVYNFVANCLRANGHSKLIMTFSLVSGAVKVGCSCLFVAVFRMGVAGVALGTIVSWVVYAVLGFYFLAKGDGAVKLCKEHLKLYRPELPQILKIGVPTGLQMGLYSIANVVISSAVNSFGAQATTGVSIANTFDGILYNLSHAASIAVMPFVSQNLGAHNTDRAWKSVWKGILLTAGIAGSLGALSAIFSDQLSSIMSDDPAVIAYARQKMIIISSTYFICGINDVFNAALRSMGKAIVPTINTMIFMCALRFVWVYLIFPLFPNLTFLYTVWPIGWTCSIICAMIVYFLTKKKLNIEHAPLA